MPLGLIAVSFERADCEFRQTCSVCWINCVNLGEVGLSTFDAEVTMIVLDGMLRTNVAFGIWRCKFGKNAGTILWRVRSDYRLDVAVDRDDVTLPDGIAQLTTSACHETRA
jgi:hypothetical protein